ncbi:MAG: PAS domain S-box protein [Chitinophagaceae bacterium]|nr:PAS domain S-box protein [Chitinophagaceae bacterium]
MISETLIPEPFIHTDSLYFVLINAEGYYSVANPYFLKKFGLSEAAVTSVHSFETIFPEDRPACSKAVEFCISHPGRSIKVDLKKPDVNGGVVFTRWEFTSLQNNKSDYIQCIGYDISQETIEAVRKEITARDEMHEELLSNSIDVFLLTNEKRQITYCSPNVTKMFGYEVSELIGKNGFSFVHPDDLPIALKAFEEEIVNPGVNHSEDIRFRHKDGSWKWAEAKGRNLFNNPRVQSMMLSLNDISMRKRSEEALAESELRYKSFFNQLPVPLFIVSDDHEQILDVNDSAVEKYGYSKKEFSEFSFSRLFKDQLTDAEAGEVYSKGKVVAHKTKAGKNILVTIEKRKVEFSETNGNVLLVNDITESNNIQQENELSYEVSEILIQPRSLRENLETALKSIRLFTSWDLAELWVPGQEGLSIKKIAFDADEGIYHQQIRHFLQLTSSFEYPVKDYDPSIATSYKPYWIENLSENKFEFKRKKIAESTGFQSCLIVPVFNDKQLICVFSFFSFALKHYSKSETNLLSILGKLFGAEIEKRKNSLMLDTFFQISNDILTIAGLDGRYKRVNPAFEKFIGYTNEEAKKIHPLSYVHDFDKEAVLEKLKELSNGTPVPYFENRVITKERATKWVAWTATPIITEGIVIASHRDITAQKEAAEELRIFNERYELVTKATNEAIWDLDLVTNRMAWSEGYKILFGHGFDDNENDLDFWEANIHPDEKETVIEGFNRFLKQRNTPYWECEYRFRKSDGTYAHVLDKGYLIFNKDNTPLRMVGAMQDITERKKLEQELLVRERNKQNQIAQAVVFAQETERAEIGKELHDNVGQLLTTTKLYLEMLKHKLDDPLELIERGTRHINMVIHTIRNLSHSLVPASINDLGLIASVNDLIENVQVLEKIDINYVSPPDLEVKIGKSLKLTLYRIIQEQLNNIIKHAYATRVTIELFEEDGFIKLIITDDGKGFEVETVKMGLGLKNITSRAELQNGTVNIVSNPDEGCKIIIQIPINY